MSTLSVWAVLLLGTVACVTDLRFRRIPNWLTFSAAFGAVVVHALTPSGLSVGQSLAGLVVGLVLFLPLFLLGGMGGGDVKLLAALGAWVGPTHVLPLAAYASMAGGVIAVAVALQRGYLRTLIRNISNLLYYWWLVGPRPMAPLTLERGTGPRLAYAIPIFVGTVVAIWQQ